MVHYHVWFNLKPDIRETSGLATVSELLRGLCSAGGACNYKMLTNNSKAPRSKLARFHALVEFESIDQLNAAMKTQTQAGIRTGLHGAVVDVVTDFHVEIFTLIESGVTISGLAQYACEI